MPTITNPHMELELKGADVTITCTYDLAFTKNELKGSTKYKEWILVKGVDVGEKITHTGGNIINWDYVGMFPVQTLKLSGDTKPRSRPPRTYTLSRWRLVEDQYLSDDEIQCEIRVGAGNFNDAKPVFTNVITLKKLPKPV